MIDPNRDYKLGEVAEMLKVHRQTIARKITKGLLKGFKGMIQINVIAPNGKEKTVSVKGWYIKGSDLLDYLKKYDTVWNIEQGPHEL